MLQPADRARHPDDRWPVEARRLEPAGVRPAARRARPRSTVSNVKWPPNVGCEPLAHAGRDREGAHPLRPEQPLLGRHRVHVGAVAATSTGIAPAALRAVDDQIAPRAWASSAIAATGRTAPVAHSTWRDDDRPGPLVDRLRRRPRGPRRGRPPRRRRRTRARRRAGRAGRSSRPMPPGCSWRGRHGAVAGPPVERPRRRCSSRRSWRGSARCRPSPPRAPRRRRPAPRPSAGAVSSKSATWPRPTASS